MKLSVNQEDPGYHHDAKLYSVRLDGKLVRPCDLIAADDETGIVCTYKRHPNGELVSLNGDTVTVIRRGKVTITAPESAPAKEYQEVPFS